jgi:protein-S-isoprenylcysteine O-methyltransferase Ste14
MTRIPALGPRGEGWLALQLTLIALIASAGIVAPAAARFEDPFPGSRVVGQLVVLAGLGLIVWGSAALRAGGSFSTLPRPRPDGTLVEDGPYRYLRHPLYAGLVVAGVGAGLARSSWLELGLTALLFVVLDFKRRREEAWLLTQYPGYEAYRNRTKALVPFLY